MKRIYRALPPCLGRVRLAVGILIGTVLVGASAFAAPQDVALPSSIDGLDRQLAELFKAGKVPGAAVVLIENGHIVFEKGYGFADVGRQIPATSQTPFRAASIAKGLTAIGFMALVERGRLALDTPLHAIAPEIAFTNPWEKTDPVRLVNLLEHTTGWPDIPVRVLAKSESAWSTLEGIAYSSPGFTSRWKPGMFTVYNNAGPAVAGYAMEKVTGQTFDDYMRATVLMPMGMLSADFSLTPALANNIAKSYGSDGAQTPYQHIVLKPSGSLVVSAHELAQLARFYIGRGSVDGRQILTPESVVRIERGESNLGAKYGFSNSYGLGNLPIADSGITFRGHNGSIDSFTSVLGYSLRNGAGYVLMANGGDGVDFAGPAAHLVQSWLTRGQPLRPQPTIELSDAALQKYAGYYRSITPPNDLLRPYAQMFGVSSVAVGKGKLVVSGKDYLPTGQHSFRRADRSESTLAFVEHEGQIYKINATSAQQKAGLSYMIRLWATGAILVLGLLVGIVMLIPWAIASRRGRLAASGGLLYRLLPLVAIGALGATLALPLLAFSDSGGTSVQQLAGIGPYSLSILIGSLLYPLLALLGMVLSVRNRTSPPFIRAYVGLSSLALLGVAAYAASIDWLPLRTWAM